MNDEQIEQEIQDKGLTAPRVTTADIEAAIASEHYFTAMDGAIASESLAVDDDRSADALSRMTFCVLVMINGFTVTGESVCVSAANFDAELGRKVARQNAIDKCWPLFGFALACDITSGKTTIPAEG